MSPYQNQKIPTINNIKFWLPVVLSKYSLSTSEKPSQYQRHSHSLIRAIYDSSKKKNLIDDMRCLLFSSVNSFVTIIILTTTKEVPFSNYQLQNKNKKVNQKKKKKRENSWYYQWPVHRIKNDLLS